MTKTFVIAVSGGSGSGKTYFAEALYKKIGSEKSFILYQDNYYIDQSHKFDFDGGSVNFDHPDALDFELMATHLKELKSGTNISIPLYDFATHKRLDRCIEQSHKKIVIIDGILILTQPKLRELFDMSIYIKTPEKTRYERRLDRDVSERGRTPEGVKAQFENQVKPMHDLFVSPSQKYAQYINSGTDMEAFYSLLEEVTNEVSSI